jgi:D-glycero-D-manno-heptose 1,7-bisphosphate phosphatase
MKRSITKKGKFDLIILAGGKGSRISKFLKGIPKPLIKVKKLDFIEILLKNFSKYNVNKIFIAAGYRGRKIYKKYHKKKINLIDIECVIESKTLGTGGALSQFKGKTTKNFFVINGDTFFDVNLNHIFDQNRKHNKIFIPLSNSKNYKSNKKLTNLSLINKKIIFKEKSGYFNGGVYFLNKSIFKKIPEKNFSFEDDLLKLEIQKNNVIGGYYNDFFLDIGTPRAINIGIPILTKYLEKPAIFLDRDGTLIEDKGYTYKLNDLKFINKVIELLNKYKSRYYIFIVTNQSGIGRGYYTEKDFFNFQKKIKENLYKKNILIDDIRYCPFIPDAKIKKYRRKSKFRKPDNYMIKSLNNNFFIDLKNSIMIGNTEIDKQCAVKSNLRYIDVNKIY